MAKRVLVIGLGRFGMALGKAMVRRGVEVIGVDRNADRVQKASEELAEAVSLDATDADAIAGLGPERSDICVCAIGDESTEAAILCTALLRQSGGKRVVARASDALQARILRMVGAHDVVNPLQEFGDGYAWRLLYDSILGELALGDGLILTHVRPPEAVQGRPLAEVELPKRHRITVVAIRGADGRIRLPGPDEVIAPDDVLVVVSEEQAITRFLEKE